jgi:hypothetical protein
LTSLRRLCRGPRSNVGRVEVQAVAILGDAQPVARIGIARNADRDTVAWSTASICVAMTIAGRDRRTVSSAISASITIGPMPPQAAPQACTTITSGRSAAITSRTSSHRIVSPAQ